jgi:aminoglycoside phosphotransferase (APT) family kinase protein
VPHDSQPNPAEADRQDLLAASRRIDWRFLLPDPRLRRVALAGGDSADLREALALLGAELVEGSEAPDVLVVAGADADALEAAAGLVPPGGFLYAELRGPFARPEGALALLRRLGFDDPTAHWHYPSFDRCEEIVPLGSEEVVRHALGRRASRLRRSVGRVLHATGLLARVVPSVSVLGRRLDAGEPAGTPAPNGATSLLASPDLRSLLVTPRFAASRHVVFLLFPPREDEPSLVAKMPRLPDDVGGIEREAVALGALDRLRADGFDGAPRVVAFEDEPGRALLAETALPGGPITPAEVRRSPERCLDAVVSLLTQIGVADARAASEDPGWYERLLEEPLRRLAASFEGGDEPLLVERTLELVSPLRDAPVPLVLEHGDVSHPNLLLHRGGQAALIDWELSEPRGLPAHDLFFFLAYMTFALRRAGSTERRRAVFRETFFGPREAYAETVVAYAERLGAPVLLLRPLFVACWARYAAQLTTRLRVTGGEGRASAASLRRHREYALWRETVESAGELRLPGG